MLPKLARLNLKKDFTWARGGQLKEGGLMRVFVRLGQNSLPKVGVATSGKVFKKAVERNRARRMVEAAAQKLYSKLPTQGNILVMPKHSILSSSSDKVAEELNNLLK